MAPSGAPWPFPVFLGLGLLALGLGGGIGIDEGGSFGRLLEGAPWRLRLSQHLRLAKWPAFRAKRGASSTQKRLR